MWERVIAYHSQSVVAVAVLPAAVAMLSASVALSETYNITPAEKAACTADAARLCLYTYPDEGKLLGCMAANRSSLTKSCLVVFNAGVKRRHLVVR